MTYQNLGFWIGQANDVSTGAHPTGWTNGQRWSETAGEWQTMYSSSQSALGSMTSDRDYWKTTVAHDDPNVWTNRYNAGVAAVPLSPASPLYYDVVPSSTTSAPGSNVQLRLLGAVSASSLSVTNNTTSLTINKTGYFEVSLGVGINNTGGNTGQNWGVTLNVGGVTVSQTVGVPPGGGNTVALRMMTGAIGAGTVVQVNIQGSANDNGNANGGYLRIVFVPTTTYPN